jgi:L-rhamnose mutarotase
MTSPESRLPSHSSTSTVAFTMAVRQERLDDFRAAHQNVWPDYLDQFVESGITAYTSFLTDDGLFIAVVTAQEPAAALARLGSTEVDARWQEYMRPLFAGAMSRLLPPVFELGDALAAVGK